MKVTFEKLHEWHLKAAKKAKINPEYPTLKEYKAIYRKTYGIESTKEVKFDKASRPISDLTNKK